MLSQNKINSKLFVMILIMVVSSFVLVNAETIQPGTGPLSNDPGVSQPSPSMGTPGSAPNYGLALGNNMWISAASFAPLDSNMTWSYSYPGYIYRTGGTNIMMWASVNLPRGVIINGMDTYYYDGGSSLIEVSLLREYDTTIPGENVVAYFDSVGTPGYTSTYLTIGQTFEPWDSTYYNAFYAVLVKLYPADNTIRFKGVRIWYSLQSSPAPSSATFSDVSTSNPFFSYIEALASSGITTGCTASQFCPNNPVTRAQMAKFLSTALGLYWPY